MTNRKKGVSLIAVLLFMLVATIAATATFKWLNSEGHSSADRLMLSEARQSAVAGIEAARSWMTYHGNETGALIKQYFNDGKAPILLDSVLSPLTNGQQSFSVMLVGVDVSNATYKLKLSSTGTARNGTSFSEEAIMNVNGLYRVAIPSTKSTLEFNYALFTSSITYEGTNKLQSAVINGDWNKNPPITTGDFVVTGNATLSGSSLNIGGTACIGGNLDANNGISSNNLYVRGKTSGSALSISTTGSAYLDGPLTQGDQAITFNNLTINDTINTKLQSNSFTVTGDFCVDQKGAVNNNSTSRAFQVNGDVWIPTNHIPFLYDKQPLTSSQYNNVVLGDDSGDKIYILGAHPSSDYASFYESKKFIENSSYKKNCPTSFQLNGSWNWNSGASAYVFSGNGDWNTCGTQAWFSPSWGNNYVEYKKGWNNWGGNPYYAYEYVSSKTDMYYIYYNDPGVTDVEFKEYPNDYWWYYTGGNAGVGAPSGGIALELDRGAFRSHFGNPTPVGAYFVGGQLYFDTYSVWNTYHYENGKPTGSPYCYKNNDYQPRCAVAPWFKALGTVQGSLPSTIPPEVTCSNSAKAHCDSIWTEKAGCDGSKYKVDDPLVTALSSFEAKANNLACSKSITSLGNPGNTQIENLNSCYAQTVANADSAVKLYNGFLVVKFSSIDQNAAPTTALDGKFIIIVENKPSNYLKLGPSNGVTMIYLKKGAPTIYPSNCNSKQTYKYFIYSEEDIDMIGGFKESTCQIQGTVFATSNGCKKVKSANGNEGEFLKTDPTIIDALAEASAICPPGGTCGSSATTGASEGLVTTITYSGYDTDYIATGAQLKIEMESQYKNEESYTNAKNIKPSIVVLPRIVYLNADAIGKLSDYYTVMPLNGATANGSGTVSCPAGAPPTSGPLSATDSLKGGFYYCTYTENGYSSSFHIVVTGKMSETPNVHFDGTESIELNAFTENVHKVNLIVSATTASGTTPFTVNISVSKSDMNGWHVEPTSAVTKVSESNGTTIYSYTGTASSSEQTIELFSLSTDAGAQTGSVNFMLQNPSNCIVMAPMFKSFAITGATTVKRGSLKEYCTAYPDNCSGDDAVFGIVQDYEDCDFDGIWVSAHGDGCGATENNEAWKCAAGNAAGNPIFLEEKNYSTDLCKAYIPTANNNIVGAVDDKVNPDGYYTLYASLKKKKHNLHVSLSGAKNGSEIIVRSKSNLTDSYTNVGSCDKAEGCAFSFYSGKYVQIEANISGDDKFSYWTCLSGKCSSVNSIANPLQLVIDGNYDYEAKFNEVDPHCFYTEFSDVKAFCANGEETECIDKCSGSTPCNSGAGAYGTKPNWLMVYTNQSGSYVAPEIMGGYIFHNGSSTAGNQSVLLSRVVAGNNGTMSARIMMDQFSSGKSTAIVNNGFILRSNADASSYLLLNVYGKDGYGTYARICYVEGQNVADATQCVDKQVRTGTGSSPSILGTLEPVDVSVNINGDKVELTLNYEHSKAQASASFNLTDDWENGDLNDINHRYVGLMLTDKEFKVSDIGWRATDFPNEACFDYPSVSCSFAANYLGGKVPLDSFAMPWVGFSSWYGNHEDCIAAVNYYYNGCDVPSSQFEAISSELSAACPNDDSEGLYKIDTVPNAGMKLNGAYKFEMEGKHGTVGPGNVGHVQNAFVSVTCGGVPSNSGCGEFYVGKMNECSKNEMIAASSLSKSTSPHTISLSAPVNLRGATLAFNIETLDDGEYIEITLEDEAGVQSATRSVTRTNSEIGTYEFEGLSRFNPEKVSKVILKGSANYTLKTVNSSCPNAVSIHDCHASYAGSHWTIGSTINHVENALKCRVKPNTTDFTGSSDFVECSSMSFQVNDPSFYDRLNTSSVEEISYSFTVEVFDVETPDVNGTPAATCEATSDTYKHATATCNLDKNSVLQGEGVPVLTYSIMNCPDYGCKYYVGLTDAIKTNDPARIPPAGVSNESWQPSINLTESNKLDVGSYSYDVKVYNSDSTQVIASCTDDITFNVVKPEDATGECSISGSSLHVSVTGANHGTEGTAVMLATSDVLGNILNFSSIAIGASHDTTIDLSANSNLIAGHLYPFTLTVNSVPINCGSYHVPYVINLECPADLTGKKAGDEISVAPQTLTGCDGHCDWSLSGGGVSLSGTDYNGEEITFDDDTGSGEVNYTLTLTRDSTSNSPAECSFKVTYKTKTNISATCIVSNDQNATSDGSSIYNTKNVYFRTKNNANVADMISPLTLKNDATSLTTTWSITNYSNWSSYDMDKLTVGSHTIQLLYDGDVVCSKTITVKDPASDAAASCVMRDGSNITVTSVYPSAYVKFAETASNSTGSSISTKLTGKECQMNNGNCSSVLDLSKDLTWYENGTLEHGFNAPKTPGPYTYTLSSGTTTLCTTTLIVKDPVSDVTANCVIRNNSNEIVTSVYAAEYIKFAETASNSTGSNISATLTGKECQMNNGNCASEIDLSKDMTWYGNGMLEHGFNAPKTPGPYTYTLSSGTTTLCSVTLTVTSPLSCAVDKTEIGLGESFKFTPTYGGDCYNGTFSYGSYTDNNGCNSNNTKTFTVTPTSVGEVEYTFSVTNGNKGTASCSKKVKVNEAPPTCSVEDMTAQVGTDVTIKPTSTGCTSGPCSYTITGGTKGGTSGTGYQDADEALGNTLPGETSASSDGISYSLVLTNSKGNSEPCSFKVKYTEEEVVSCHCEDYCSSGCDNIKTSGQFDGGAATCMFVTKVSVLNGQRRNGWTINGADQPQDQRCWGEDDCDRYLSNYTKADGGWYIYADVDWAYIVITEGHDPCAGGGGSGGGESGGGESGGNGSSADNPIDNGSIDGNDHKQNYSADTWYSVSTSAGLFVIQNHTGNEATLTYKDCNGADQSKTIKKGQEGDQGSGWWNGVTSVSNGCSIKFKFSITGDFDLRVW